MYYLPKTWRFKLNFLTKKMTRYFKLHIDTI